MNLNVLGIRSFHLPCGFPGIELISLGSVESTFTCRAILPDKIFHKICAYLQGTNDNSIVEHTVYHDWAWIIGLLKHVISTRWELWHFSSYVKYVINYCLLHLLYYASRHLDASLNNFKTWFKASLAKCLKQAGRWGWSQVVEQPAAFLTSS